MSVNKMRSKLAQGARRVKAPQIESSVVTEPKSAALAESTPAADVAELGGGRPVVKRAAAKVSLSSTLHPSRVWPD